MATIHLDLDEIEVPAEPSVEFTLDGRTWTCKNRLALPALIVDAAMGGIPMRIDTLYRGLLCEKVAWDGEEVDQADEFIALLARPDSPLTVGRAVKLAETLVEAILNRPTLPSGRSQPGRRTTRATSRAVSSSKAARSKKRAG